MADIVMSIPLPTNDTKSNSTQVDLLKMTKPETTAKNDTAAPKAKSNDDDIENKLGKIKGNFTQNHFG